MCFRQLGWWDEILMKDTKLVSFLFMGGVDLISVDIRFSVPVRLT